MGIDFGTTRTIVAGVDRGNYPVVSFTDDAGDSHEYFPSVVALDGDELVFGFEALTAADAGAPLVRSFKRVLGAPFVTPSTTVRIGDRDILLLDVLTGFLGALRTALLTRSSLASTHGGDAGGDVLAGHAAVGVPAHAPSAQRFLTLEAFQRAGFEVAAMINEPSAAGFEYTHRQGRTVTSRRTRVLVYDLGGGTFDASLVRVDGKVHEIVGSLGLNMLGGDDFDAVLARCVLEEADLTPQMLGERGWAELLDDCRAAKEHLSPQTKRLAFDVAGRAVTVRVQSFYEAAAGLVDATIDAMAPLVGGLDSGAPDLEGIAGIYLVGGASGLPLIPRVLRERFGRRVHRSPYPAASTAIGLAIAADDDAGYSLTDRLSRGFGVFREGSGGRRLKFDALLTRDEAVPVPSASLPSSEPRVAVTRRYRAAHNLGWFRFVEYTSVDEAGEPRGDIAPFGEVLFPFDPALRDGRDLPDVTVLRREGGPMIEEEYLIDGHGIVQVRITDLDTGYTVTQELRSGHAEAVPAR